MQPTASFRHAARFAAFLLLACAAPVFAQQGRVIDRIVAVVGNEVITQTELDFQMMRLSLRNPVTPNDTATRRRVLEELINQKLVLAQAILDSVSVSDEQVNNRLSEQIRYYEQQYGSVEKLEQAVGMSVTQMKREFREEIRKRLMIDALQNERFGTVAVTNREVEEFYRQYLDSIPRVPEQVQLRQITLFPRVGESFKTAAQQKAQRLLDSLRHGADFAALSTSASDDAGSAANGGDLGFARRGVFVKEFEEAAFALQPGELSPVVETQFGFHIIKMVERKGESIRVQHILVRVQRGGDTDSSTVRALQDLRRRAAAGEDFAALAKEHSEDVSTKNMGGDLGLLEIEQLSDDMKTAQQSLRAGEITPPVRLAFDRDYGYAIIQLVRRVAPHRAVLPDDYTRVAGYARIYKQNRLYADWIDEIRGNVYWKIID
jgi:peptidyl-prolyl cis-trans isomerase SurA